MAEKSVEAVSVSVVQDDVAVIRINDTKSKVNVLGKAISEDLKWAFDQVEKNDAVKSVVLISGKIDCFIAGADITMLEKIQSVEEATQISRDAQAYFDRIERSPKPVVAAIMGTCMGGGLEMVLACHYRIAVNTASTVFSLPEVKLGLIPGAGGTQRLPKLVSMDNALDMVLTGRNVKPKRARQMGLVDLLVQEHLSSADTLDYLKEIAVEVARGLSSGQAIVNRKRPVLETIRNRALTTKFALEHLVLKKAKEDIARLSRGHFPASYEILDAVKSGILDARHVGFRYEAEAFGRLSQTTECKALIGLFMAQTLCKKNRYGRRERIMKIAVEVNSDAVDLIPAALKCEVDVVLYGNDLCALEKAKNAVNMQLKRHRPSDFERLVARLNVFDSLRAFTFAECQLVFCGNYEEIEKLISNDCAIVLKPSRCGEPFTDGRVLRMRFHAKNQMVQIVPLSESSKEAVAIVADFCAMLKMTVVKSTFDAKGFYEEAVKLLAEGMPSNLIDLYCKEFGFGCEVLFEAKKEGFALCEASSPASPITPVKEDVQKKLCMNFVNCALKSLELNEIESSADLDMLSVALFGFPAHLGGPCKYTDLVGSEELVSEMRLLGIVPCDSLREGKRFH